MERVARPPVYTAVELRQRRAALRRAQDHFTRAAAALTAWEGDPEAFAMVEGARAMMALAEADPHKVTLSRVERWLAESTEA